MGAEQPLILHSGISKEDHSFDVEGCFNAVVCVQLHLLSEFKVRHRKYRRRYATQTRAATALHPPQLTSKRARAVPLSAILF